MTAETIETIQCVGCGASVPYGRLSCSACGALLASVAGAVGPAPFRREAVAPAVAAEPAGPAGDRSAAQPERPTASGDRAVTLEPSSAVAPSPARARVPGPADPRPIPGAYRPPVVPDIARATADPADDAAGGVPVGPGGRGRSMAHRSVPGDLDRGRAGTTRASGTVGRIAEIADWFVVVGAAMAILGFLLPWSRIAATVAGSGYFDRWGLANPSHLLVLAGLLVVLGLAVMRTPVPAWIGSGVLGLASGGLLLGLAWPFLAGPPGAGVGITVTSLGAVALMVGGTVSSWATRRTGTAGPG